MSDLWVEIFDIKITTLPVTQVIEAILACGKNRRKSIFAYANIHALNLAFTSPAFHRFFEQAELTFCDGFGVRLGASLLGKHLPHRYTPPDWFPHLAAAYAQAGLSIYFLGAKPDIARQYADSLELQLPELRIAGVQHGYFNRSLGHPENEAVLSHLAASRPNLLVVGLGMPTQELWILDNWERLPDCPILPVGAMLDYLTGNVPRAPRWMTDHGMEWLGRLIIEPGRLWKRYLLGNPLFLWRILQQRLKQEKVNE